MTIHTTFGTPRRESSYPALDRPDGRLVWSLGLPSLEGEPIQSVIPWRGNALVVSATRMTLVAAPHRGHRTLDAPGVAQWTQRIAHGTPVVVSDNAAHCLDPNLGLVVRDLDGAPLNEPHVRLPGLGAKGDVSLLLPRGDEFTAVLQYVGQLHGDPPHTRAITARNGARFSDWGLERPGVVRPPAIALPNRGRMYWRTDPGGEVIYADLDQRKVGAPFQLPLDTLVEWSASSRGRVYAVGMLNDQPTALAFTGLGEELWRWSDPSVVGAWSTVCPPAVCEDDTVLCFGDGEVLALRRGSVQWWSRLPGQGAMRGAILADASSLVVRGSVLRHFGPSGEKRFEVDLGGDVVAGPVVTSTGWINLATARDLLGVC